MIGKKLKIMQNAQLKAQVLFQQALEKHAQSMISVQAMVSQRMMELQNGNQTSQQPNLNQQPILTPEGNALPPNG